MRFILAVLSIFWAVLVHAADPRVLIVVGPSNHPPGSHEVAAGGRLLKYCLENPENYRGIQADLVQSWPDRSLRDSAETVVFIGDTFPANRFPDASRNLSDLEEMMKRGCGIVCVHYATGLLGQDVRQDGDHPLLRWLGGYFANRSCPHHESFARIFPESTIVPATSEHPITRGWKPFTLHDEPYYNNYFGPENKMAPNVIPLASSMLPPDKPKKETVAWCVERKDGGRGFGIVMPHFYKNWSVDDLRCFILNGIVWTAKQEVPQEGIRTKLPDLSNFQPASVDFQPMPRK
jgi:type 1 glutamine amidotransferase